MAEHSRKHRIPSTTPPHRMIQPHMSMVLRLGNCNDTVRKVLLLFTFFGWRNWGTERISNLPKVIHLADGKARIWGLAPEPFLLICHKKKALIGKLTYNFLPLFLASRLWENVSFICSFIWNPIYPSAHPFIQQIFAEGTCQVCSRQF